MKRATFPVVGQCLNQLGHRVHPLAARYKPTCKLAHGFQCRVTITQLGVPTSTR
jgi:hypothetical protein